MRRGDQGGYASATLFTVLSSGGFVEELRILPSSAENFATAVDAGVTFFERLYCGHAAVLPLRCCCVLGRRSRFGARRSSDRTPPRRASRTFSNAVGIRNLAHIDHPYRQLAADAGLRRDCAVLDRWRGPNIASIPRACGSHVADVPSDALGCRTSLLDIWSDSCRREGRSAPTTDSTCDGDGRIWGRLQSILRVRVLPNCINARRHQRIGNVRLRSFRRTKPNTRRVEAWLIQ